MNVMTLVKFNMINDDNTYLLENRKMYKMRFCYNIIQYIVYNNHPYIRVFTYKTY